jgi:hypothetical protein
MKRNAIKKVGKKGREWLRERAKLIKDAVAEGRIEINEAGNIYGICEDCKKWKALTPDHRCSRGQGGGHEKSNIDWVCTECHRKRDQQGDPMGKKKKTKKPAWQQEHRCKNCRGITRHYICHLCGKVSIK